jgi:hypothetical protein
MALFGMLMSRLILRVLLVQCSQLITQDFSLVSGQTEVLVELPFPCCAAAAMNR